MRTRGPLAAFALVAAFALMIPCGVPAAAQVAHPEPVKLDPVEVAGLHDSVRIRRDANEIPHIFALNDHDALFMLGWVHAQDRFFQMDLLRRTFSGTVASLVGQAGLPQDVELRTLGLRRAAEASLPVVSDELSGWLSAYAEGVNAYLASGAPLPFEYTALELSQASVPAWTPLDSLTIAKGLAFGLSFDLSELDFTEAFLTFQAAGAAGGFDGTALFSEDLFRSAPFDPSVSIPDFLDALGAQASPLPAPSAVPARQIPSYLGERTLGLIRQVEERARGIALVEDALKRKDSPKGSNWWIASGAITASGYPMLASDPHLSLDSPSTFYEAHMRVAAGVDRPMNISGVTFPGAPAVALGCNPWICWGGTVNSLDVTDVYQEQLVVDFQTMLPTGTIFDGQPEPVVLIPQSYQVNVVGDATPDNLVDSGLGPLDGGLTVIVPRRNNGPIVALDLSDPFNVIGFSVQYTGWGPTRELDAFRAWARAGSVEKFVEGLQFFDFGSQNWSYADVNGNIAYFTSGELPIREDLQNLLQPDGGIPPIFVRDGTHTLQHEWLPVANPQPQQSLPFEILPFAEMPQEVNPARGYILNANNDPVGTTLDNNVFNQLRPGGGIYYLAPGYATGFRMGRLQRLFDDALAGGGGLTPGDFAAFQANNQLLDAEVLVPYVLAAFGNAGALNAAPELMALAADPGVAEAVGRLGAWDFSTPTGIPEGYDPGDDFANLPAPTLAEVESSVAATIYSAWRGQVVQRVIDDSLGPLAEVGPGSALAMSALRNLLDNFGERQGVGASGLPFFVVPGVANPADARDVILLACLRDALDLLASPAFDAAFGGSEDQGDYRWGALHRIVFDHPLGGPFDVPNAGGVTDLSPVLRGVARSGGFGAVDASSHSARADGLDEFMFGSGPARRIVAHMTPEGVDAQQAVPGDSQLKLWLTNHYHPVHLTPGQVVNNTETFQQFFPAP